MSEPRDFDRGALEAERDFLLRSLDDLDAEREVGNVDDGTYQTLHDDYTARAATIIRSLDAGTDLTVARPAARVDAGPGVDRGRDPRVRGRGRVPAHPRGRPAPAGPDDHRQRPGRLGNLHDRSRRRQGAGGRREARARTATPRTSRTRATSSRATTTPTRCTSTGRRRGSTRRSPSRRPTRDGPARCSPSRSRTPRPGRRSSRRRSSGSTR